MGSGRLVPFALRLARLVDEGGPKALDGGDCRESSCDVACQVEDQDRGGDQGAPEWYACRRRFPLPRDPAARQLRQKLDERSSLEAGLKRFAHAGSVASDERIGQFKFALEAIANRNTVAVTKRRQKI